MKTKVNKVLLDAILAKRVRSEQLNNEEENYARKIFDEMMVSKKQVRKVVRIVTGEQLRKERSTVISKSKTDAEATRKDPRYTEGKNPQSIKSDNPNPDVESLKSKIPDVDEKPKTGPQPGYEQQRVADMTQEPVPPRTEALKFTSADPVSPGDIVSKNMMRHGTQVVKGLVLKVKDDLAVVKWNNGRTMTEPAHLLVKVKKTDDAAAASDVKEDPKLGVSEADEEAYNTPMTKNGDIAAAQDYSSPGPMKTTPFQDLTSSLQRVVDLAAQLKEKQDNTEDQDIKNHYDGLIGKIREVAEMILAGLADELQEAESEYDENE